jgi:hypothetical protein
LNIGDPLRVIQVPKHCIANAGLEGLIEPPRQITFVRADSPAQVKAYFERFSKSVLQAVIDSPWVALAD